MRIVLIGAGQRGRVYADYMHKSGRAQIVAIVEPDQQRRLAAADHLNVPQAMCFAGEGSLWALGKIADGAIIASMDQDHYAQAIKAMEMGYDLLLEKPVSPVMSECLDIRERARSLNRRVTVCHVLRYAPFFSTLKQLLDKRVVGKPISILHEENIGNFHMAHSFVRGNWANQAESSPIILQKSCHDMDLLVWLTGSRCKALSSVGALTYFKIDKAPVGSAERCVDCGVRAACRFDAEKNYMPVLGSWPATVLTTDQTPEGLREAIRTGPYGRCVYRCPNDVCDHQTTLMEMENGVTISFVMSAFTNRMNRSIRILCEDGEISGDDEAQVITVTRFVSNAVEAFSVEQMHTQVPHGWHGGGDIALVEDFLRTLEGDETESVSSIERSIESHLMAFAAERSRLSGGGRVALDALR
ncbi:MAG: Gfo/Idh/MocA family oxidoreductase [Clostridia bacterium]|nr:Gfo/Idh/MocA family oxidoreductase [Clostridia bacterium]